MARKYGPMAKLLDEEQVEFLQLYYKTKGITWCSQKLGVSHSTLKEMVMRWEADHGPIDFCESRPIQREPRRLFKKEPEERYNSCRRWGDIFNKGETRASAIPGRRIV